MFIDFHQFSIDFHLRSSRFQAFFAHDELPRGAFDGALAARRRGLGVKSLRVGWPRGGVHALENAAGAGWEAARTGGLRSEWNCIP